MKLHTQLLKFGSRSTHLLTARCESKKKSEHLEMLSTRELREVTQPRSFPQQPIGYLTSTLDWRKGEMTKGIDLPAHRALSIQKTEMINSEEKKVNHLLSEKMQKGTGQ
jgi:hypothetical protein